jgi:signal transduction histidine kinase/CheY-like chemotaxis protein
MTAAALATAIAMIGLSGHALAVPALYSLHVGFQAMSLTTGLGLTIVGLAQIAFFTGRRPIAAGLARVALTLAAIILTSHAVSNGDVVNPTLAAAIGLDPAIVGRTSVSTAIAIVCLSFALLPRADRVGWLGDALATTAFLIALLALAGYAYSSSDLYALPIFRTMALNTAIVTLLLSIASILGKQGKGWALTIGAPGEAGATTRRQLLLLIVPPILGWFLVRAANADLLQLGSAMALLVVLTIAPFLWLILRDGQRLIALDQERARSDAMEAAHLDTLEARLAAQAVELDDKNRALIQSAERAQAASEGRYRQLFDSIDAGFCVIEMRFAADGKAEDYRFVEVNRSFVSATGLQDAQGRWMRELAPEHEQHWFDTYGEIARTRTPLRFESPARALEDRWYDVHAFPVDDPALNRVGVLFNDVTVRRRAEIALRELNATLEQRVEAEVAERELAQAALRQSQKMEAMGQLTGGVAHDFNNLLTPIVGSLDMLSRREGATDREKRLIDGALQSAERARVLVQRLLAFARRQPLQPGPVDVAALIEGMADLVISTSGPQIRVQVDTGDALPPAIADANQLEMAILNLCVNARDAMPDGGTLTIAAAAEALDPGAAVGLPAGRYVRLTVADTGTGMDEETAKRAVEPFYSTKGVGKGTGLGLSMVHGLAAQLGGTLDIRSQKGLGTRIDLWLPASEATAAVEAAGGPDAAIERVRGSALVVDHEAVVRMTTSDMLQDLGYATTEVATAREAVELLDRGAAFDLVVTDHMMPGMTGGDLAVAIRTTRPGLPVLLVTGYAEAEGIAADIPRLTKPFRQEELARALAEIV